MLVSRKYRLTFQQKCKLSLWGNGSVMESEMSFHWTVIYVFNHLFRHDTDTDGIMLYSHLLSNMLGLHESESMTPLLHGPATHVIYWL